MTGVVCVACDCDLIYLECIEMYLFSLEFSKFSCYIQGFQKQVVSSVKS